MNKVALLITSMIVAGGTWLRVWKLGEFSFWSGSIPDWWLPVWSMLSATGIWLSVIAGAVLIIMAYELVASVANAKGAQLSALLVALSPGLIFQARSLEAWPVLSLAIGVLLGCWSWLIVRTCFAESDFELRCKQELILVAPVTVLIGSWSLFAFQVIDTQQFVAMMTVPLAMVCGLVWDFLPHRNFQYVYGGVVLGAIVLCASLGVTKLSTLSPTFQIEWQRQVALVLNQVAPVTQVRYLSASGEIQSLPMLNKIASGYNFEGDLNWSQPIAFINESGALDQYPNIYAVPFAHYKLYVISP